ncbi:hypothetical protein BGW80DRAFT_1313485 [Lactifluus volemus]|nr:hypothetical protein BGW80DRAFT_1313485 [Lactifluus volemus]
MKGGAHAVNPGPSLTCCIEISMSRFNIIQVNNAGPDLRCFTYGTCGVCCDDLSTSGSV